MNTIKFFRLASEIIFFFGSAVYAHTSPHLVTPGLSQAQTDRAKSGWMPQIALFANGRHRQSIRTLSFFCLYFCLRYKAILIYYFILHEEFNGLDQSSCCA